jgi:nucleoside-diphosphate-sugar epimerase
MRVFVTGATGALGRHLVPGLVAAGHQVTATTRSAAKTGRLRAVGAEPIVLDGLDTDAVIAAVRAASPEVIVHQMTALADLRSLRNFDRVFAATNELRTEGTDNLGQTSEMVLRSLPVRRRGGPAGGRTGTERAARRPAGSGWPR